MHDGATTIDPDVAALLEEEAAVEAASLQLIASENFTSPAVMAVTGSRLTNRFVDGAPSGRVYGRSGPLADPDALARARACTLFGAEHANLQPHAGSSANLAVCLALLQPGDTLMGMSMEQGGHLSHGQAVNVSGQLYRSVLYGVSAGDGRLDMDSVADLARTQRPRIVFAGATAYPRAIDVEPFRAICDEVGATLVFDAAHVAGLIAGGVHPNPTPVADVVTLTTHKTLRGPRGGAVLCRNDLADVIDSAISPGLQGGPLASVIAAKAVAFAEAAQPSFRAYAEDVVRNSRALGAALLDEGFGLVTGGTDNHILLVDLRPFDADLTGRVATATLDQVGISVTPCAMPFDPRLPRDTSGIRVGTPAVTTAGMGVGQMVPVARLVARALRGRPSGGEMAKLRRDVADLVAAFPPYAPPDVANKR
ncbi:MAG: serine hydroxymethyltransferase [Acidimicrobiia bacterium]|nr:serine hydroxymethyltransferase [Acidimicrobiia bacterium]